MRYGKSFVVMVALLLIIFWGVQANAGKKIKIRAPLAQTGQEISYYPGDDGDLEKGVAWPDPRFTDQGDGTVRDNLTGLLWLQNTNCFGPQTWQTALDICSSLQHGDCSLTDSSVAGDWRLPNKLEMQSLMDFGREGPFFPLEPPFVNYGSTYWTSTPLGDNQAFFIEANGIVNATRLDVLWQAWPVRDPQ